tara:strand:+ start:261 stop:674 length:414 start_codon:yes stop_codon:yes gene_type:complete
LKKKISNTDKKDWEDFINNNQKIPDKDTPYEKDINKTSKTLDLHGYTLRDANIAVKNLIINSYNNKIDRLIIITGKGMRSKNEHDPYKSSKLSILKYSVPDYIQNDKELMDKIKKINFDDVESLNSGNFSITLKKKK